MLRIAANLEPKILNAKPMTTSPTLLATNLKDAYRVCNLAPSVMQSEELRQYYVDLSASRKTNAINSISLILEDLASGDHCTILFTGHRGCGKSTELVQIQRQWEKEYKIIYIDATLDTDVNDAAYRDIYLIVLKWVGYVLRQERLKFDAELLKNVEDWFKEVTNETEESVEQSVSLQGELTLNAEVSDKGLPILPTFLAKLVVKLLAQIRGSAKEKKTIRQTLSKDISRLQSDVNLLLADAFSKWKQKLPQCKGFLFVFDNLDRSPVDVANHLFFDYASQLKELHCPIIYTVPISVVYSPQNVNNTFENYHIIPMINIYRYDVRDRSGKEPDYDDKGLNAIASLVEKRVDVNAVFESRDGLMELAKASGGHVRQMMQMVRKAIENARSGSVRRTKVTAEDVIYAINQEQFNFERIIPTEHYPILVQVYLKKNAPKDEIGQLMLTNISVLEYNGTSRWNYPNPVVIRSHIFQRALEDYRQQNP